MDGKAELRLAALIGALAFPGKAFPQVPSVPLKVSEAPILARPSKEIEFLPAFSARPQVRPARIAHRGALKAPASALQKVGFDGDGSEGASLESAAGAAQGRVAASFWRPRTRWVCAVVLMAVLGPAVHFEHFETPEAAFSAGPPPIVHLHHDEEAEAREEWVRRRVKGRDCVTVGP
jgi:hypothetical protein